MCEQIEDLILVRMYLILDISVYLSNSQMFTTSSAPLDQFQSISRMSYKQNGFRKIYSPKLFFQFQLNLAWGFVGLRKFTFVQIKYLTFLK